VLEGLLHLWVVEAICLAVVVVEEDMLSVVDTVEVLALQRATSVEVRN